MREEKNTEVKRGNNFFFFFASFGTLESTKEEKQGSEHFKLEHSLTALLGKQYRQRYTVCRQR